MDLTREEEETMLFYYQFKMIELCEFLKAPIQVQSTSITYFKRLFAKRRIFYYDMKNLIVACVLLAIKVENIYVTPEFFKEGGLKFVHIPLVLCYELDICEALNFNFHVSSPHLRLLGLFLLLKNREKVHAEVEDSVQIQEIREIDKNLDWEKSVENLTNIMLTDEYLSLNLNEVALASLTVQPSELVGFFMPETIEAVKKIKRHIIRREFPSKEQLDRLTKKIQAIQKKYRIVHSSE